MSDDLREALLRQAAQLRTAQENEAEVARLRSEVESRNNERGRVAALEAENTRLRSLNAEKDAECKASMATIAAERERADKAEALIADMVGCLGNYVVLGPGKCSIGRPLVDMGVALLARANGGGNA
jgi:hypothetical protein